MTSTLTNLTDEGLKSLCDELQEKLSAIKDEIHRRWSEREIERKGSDREEPTFHAFPPGSVVRLKIEWEDWEYERGVGKRVVKKVYPEGTEGLILSSGDCDPYPQPYARVEFEGDQVLIPSPQDTLDIVKKDL